MRFSRWTWLLGSVALFSSPTYAFFDAQLFLGQRSAKLDVGKEQKIKGTNVKLAAHLDPIPLVPVAFGVSLASINFKDDTDEFTFDDLTGTEIGLEVMAWWPLEVFNLKPYGKFSYTLAGKYKYEEDDLEGSKVSSEYKPKGTQLALGLNWSPLPLVGFLVEVDFGNQTLESDSLKIDGISVEGRDWDMKSTDLLVGVQVGI